MIKKIKSFIFGEEKQEYKSTFNLTNQGKTGTEIYSGYYDEEYLHGLKGRERADVYDKMRRSDSQIQMLLACLKNPIKSCNWEVDPAEMNNPEYQKHADLVKRILFTDIECGWEKFLNEALTFLEFGHAVFERTHKLVKNDEEFGTYISINNLSWRSPKTLERWNLTKDGKLKTLTQYSFGDLEAQVDMDACHLLVFVLNQEGSDYQGIPILRACYGNYFRKNNYLKLNAIGIEKFAVPTPIATIPSGLEASKEKGALEEALQRYTTHQSNYVILPEGFSIIFNNNVYDPQKVEVSIDNEDKRMSKAILANFLELGQGSGSYALSNDLSDFFLSSLEYIAKNMIAKHLEKTLIKEIIDLNYPGVKKYPKLKPVGINDKAGKELAEILSMFVEKKIITADDKLEDSMRKRYSLPERSNEGVREQNPAPAGISFSERFKINKRYYK